MARRAEELIKCHSCGEMYSATYKRCPFCNGDGTGRWDQPEKEPEDDGEEDWGAARGGKRLAGGTGGYGGGPSLGRIIWIILSLVLIAAAVCIVITLVKPLLGGKNPPESQPPAPSVPAVSAPAQTSQDPAQTSQEPLPSAEVPPVSEPPATLPPAGATGFTVSKEDFSFFGPGESYRVRITFQPAGSESKPVTWKTSDAAIASVSPDGLVTAVGKGTCTVTATVEGLGEKKCIVRCNFKDAAAASPSPKPSQAPEQSAAPASGLSLNKEDFSLFSKGETFRLKVSGTDAAVTWKSSKPEVATVGSDGLVSYVGPGTCTVTATVDGQTLKCVVRCRG